MSQTLIFNRNNVNVHCMVIAFTSVDECVSMAPTEGVLVRIPSALASA